MLRGFFINSKFLLRNKNWQFKHLNIVTILVFNINRARPIAMQNRIAIRRKIFGNNDLWIVATKLLSSTDEKIGVLIVRQCCNYWGQDSGNDRPTLNRARVKSFLEKLKGDKVGITYFLKTDGELAVLHLGDGPRRFILIQVGD